jgi:hypothetical protein
MTIESAARILANGGQGGGGDAVNSGNGSGGGIFLHAPTITLGLSAAVSAEGGGGGRITFLTLSGSVSGFTNGVSVSGGAWDNPGVITYVGQPTLDITLNASGQPVISFTGFPGASYQLLSSTSLLPDSWVGGGTGTASTNGACTLIDTHPPANGAFYRVLLQTSP